MKKLNLSKAAPTVAALLLCASAVTGCSELPVSQPEAASPSASSSDAALPTATDQPHASTSGSTTAKPSETRAPATVEDYFTVTGPAEREYRPRLADQPEYCDLDELDRPVCAYALLTSKTLLAEKEQDRQNISIDPPGWQNNREVFIRRQSDTPGSKDYRGWLLNRSHLLADSLGGSASKENLITGTRTQNVGSTTLRGQYAGGMAHTELMAREYLALPQAETCALYYAATPVYQGDELVPRTVVVDVQSCDKTVDERVEVSNEANGFTIDYATGDFY